MEFEQVKAISFYHGCFLKYLEAQTAFKPSQQTHQEAKKAGGKSHQPCT
jgi:hypothetical protein